MRLDSLGIDAYQFTTLAAHAAAGRLDHTVTMSFFFRAMPAHRNYVVFAGLRPLVEHACALAFDEADLRAVAHHPILHATLERHPELAARLRALAGFAGDIDALPDGTLAFAGPGLREDGSPFVVDGIHIKLYTPLVQARTDLVRAKLIETPWLSRINYASMVASKAARVVEAAAGKPVIEFGGRRTHPAAAVDAAYAAYLAGCIGSSNVAAFVKWGVPCFGTMDHFAVQAAEYPGVPPTESERELFCDFVREFPSSGILLVDTYDTERGIANAVRASEGRLTGVRLDSNVTPATVRRARELLDSLGADHAQIWVSDQLDEYRVAALAPLADGFGVGENITCSPDAASGIGAVGKIVTNGYGKPTMKVSRGSGKATLPGALQAYRFHDHDLIALADEPAPSGGRALLHPVWRGGAPVEQPSLVASREYVRAELAGLPPSLRALEPAPRPWALVASDRLAHEVERLVKEAT